MEYRFIVDMANLVFRMSVEMGLLAVGDLRPAIEARRTRE